jgi:hypothetical protein
MTQKRKISGPGAADFLAAQGGEDIPGVSADKGETDVAKETPIVDPKNLEPDLQVDEETDAVPPTREHGTPRGRNEQ